MRSLTISIIIKTPLVRFGDLDEIEVALLASLAGSGICLELVSPGVV